MTTEEKLLQLHKLYARKDLTMGCKICIPKYWEVSWEKERQPRYWVLWQMRKWNSEYPSSWWVFWEDTWTYAVTLFSDYLLNQRVWEWNTWDKKYEIIWHELTLTDVLKALSDNNKPYDFKLENSKLKIYKNGFELIEWSWFINLSKPYLKDQDTEVIDTIFNLLTN